MKKFQGFALNWKVKILDRKGLDKILLLNFTSSGSHAVDGEKPPSSVRLPAPKSPARETQKKLQDQEEYVEHPPGSPCPPAGSYGGYHLSYEVKKLM